MRETTLMRDYPDARPPWCKTTPMLDHPDTRPPWWKTTLMQDHPDERPPWWKTTLMKDHPYERPPWCKTTLMKDHPDARPAWWNTKSLLRPLFPWNLSHHISMQMDPWPKTTPFIGPLLLCVLRWSWTRGSTLLAEACTKFCQGSGFWLLLVL